LIAYYTNNSFDNILFMILSKLKQFICSKIKRKVIKKDNLKMGKVLNVRKFASLENLKVVFSLEYSDVESLRQYLG